MTDVTRHPCPGCGFLSLDTPSGSYDICATCGWEDDPVQLHHPALAGGANTTSLWEHQRKVLARLPIGVMTSDGTERDPSWRPLLPDELETPEPPKTGVAYLALAGHAAPPYYWRR